MHPVMKLTKAFFLNLLGLAFITGKIINIGEEEETLAKSAEGLNTYLKLTTEEWCSFILITDGTSSSYSIRKVIEELNPMHGLRLYESSYQIHYQNESQEDLSAIINEVMKFRRSHECLSVIAYSDNLAFLDLLASAYQFDLLFIWKNRPTIVTSLTLKQLTPFLQRHWILFGGNAKVLQIPKNQGNKSLLKILTHLPYQPEDGGRIIRVATWSKHSGMVTMPYNFTYPEEYRESCCGGRMKMKDALNDPWTLNRLLHNPRTFRFKKPVQATVTTAEWEVHVKVIKDEKGNIAISGPMANMVNALAGSMNFTMKFIQPPDGQWGSLNADGSWTGLLGQVLRHEADFTTGPHEIKEIRTKYIDYTIPMYFDARKFIVAQMQSEVDPWGFLYPLSSLVWLLTFLSLCLVALITMAIRNNYRKVPVLSYIYAVAFHTYRLLLQQGLTMKFRMTSEKLLVASWLIATMIIYWSYNTSLISILAVRYAPKPIQTIRDLLDHDSMIVIFPYRTSLSDYLFSVESGELKEMADLSKVGRYTAVPWWKFYEVLETHVSRGTHVLATDTIDGGQHMAKYFTRTGKCQFYKARESFIPYRDGMVCQKGSPLVAAFNERFQAIFEAGLYGYWLKKNAPNSTACDHMPSRYTVREPLSITNIWGLFVTLLCGLSIAGAIFCFELTLD